jgi:hypothetical protein
MSLNSYIKNSRDINRKTNITNLEKVLTIENIEK